MSRIINTCVDIDEKITHDFFENRAKKNYIIGIIL